MLKTYFLTPIYPIYRLLKRKLMGKSRCLNFPPVTWVGVCHYCIFPAFASHRQTYIGSPDPDGQPKSLHLPLLIVHSDELPHPAWASIRLGIECNCPGDKRNSKSHQLPEGHYVKIHRTVLISDSQTCLCLCSRPSPTLDLSTSLIVSRVQDPGILTWRTSILPQEKLFITMLICSCATSLT